jgi:hypothetical protein
MHVGGLITLKLQFIISPEAVKEESVGCRMGRRGMRRFVVGGRGQF